MTTVVRQAIGGKANLEQMSSACTHAATIREAREGLRFGDTEMLGRRETPIDSRDLID